MSAQLPFSELVRAAWSAARTMPAALRARPARERAALIALQCARLGSLPPPDAAPAALNVCALADAARARLVVHALARETLDLIEQTDLRDSPPEPPALMRGPWILEASSTDALLPEGLSAIGGYELDGRQWLVGYLWADDTVLVAECVLRWGARLGEVALADNGGVDAGLISLRSREDWERPLWEGVRAAITLGLLLEARGAPPLDAADTHPRARAGASRDERRGVEQWTTRTLSLRPQARASTGSAGGSASEGLSAATVAVRGHLRRVAVGPGGAEREWAWITSHEARRWVAPLSRVRVRA